MVIPKALRDSVGLESGEVEVTVDGAAVRIEPVAGDALVERDGWLIISGPEDAVMTDDDVRALRDAGRR